MNFDHIMQLIEVAGSDHIIRDHNINVADIPPSHSSDLLILTALMALKSSLIKATKMLNCLIYVFTPIFIWDYK